MYKKDKPTLSVATIIQNVQIIQNAHNNHWGRGPDSNVASFSSMSPQSPLDSKPDTATLLPVNFSPPDPLASAHSPSSSYIGNHNSVIIGSSDLSPNLVYPPNHPLSGSKHLCAICGDRASGKHYGVYSCEGCKGFFKRTVRKDLTYACREEKACIIDKKHRNRCQFCRYMKCLSKGMKREAVQEERQRTGERGQNEPESIGIIADAMSIEKILEAEKRTENGPGVESSQIRMTSQNVQDIYKVTDKQLIQLVEWAVHIPNFTALPIDDQVILLRAGWNELLIAGFSHRSLDTIDGLVLGSGFTVYRNTAREAGIGAIFDRVLSELVSKMKEMKMDRAELGCLRTIILFNPCIKGLKSISEVEEIRNKVYITLDEYSRSTYPRDTGRFAKLLLRLPSIRSIGLECLEHLFFYNLIGDAPVDTCLRDMLESHNNTNSS